ncbi:MAG TPA: polymer-forming cytoskeletal protein [Dictyoglomaceae bacterium]|nr:polymer-forming cytoskeletal protein [Dictyoglomaceae bacterium]HOL39746.1 polymer-forming cytoskeletal protein [Dictyoglomaceae bacterium]HPP16646.1 polymer-forming cytoskeletal protein [Dictyoglomaceae bacterium]
MFRKKERPEVLDAIIGPHTELEGKIFSNASLRIDGKFKGEIEAKETVIVGNSGYVEGNIKGNRVIIIGEVVGNIYCTGSLEIFSTGKLKGDLKLGGKIVIEEGGVFLGKTETIAEGQNSSFCDVNLLDS